MNVRYSVIEQQQTEFQKLRNGVGHMKLEAESSVRNVEIASVFNIEELKNNILGLRNEVSVKKVHREKYIKHYYDILSRMEANYKITREKWGN